MQTLLRLWCKITGRPLRSYVPHNDPLVRRYARIEVGIEREASRWRPSQLIDPR